MKQELPEKSPFFGLISNLSRPGWARSLGLYLREALLLWESPAWSALLAFLVYLVAALGQGPILAHSQFPYFNYLADAFLHGQLNLRLVPDTIKDLVVYGGKLYLYWPPFPAVVLAPFVAIWGVNFSDILFTLVLGAANIGLLAVLLRQLSLHGIVPLSAERRASLVLFFAFGTAYFILAPRGRVWFTAQLIGIFFVILAYLAAVALKGWKAFFFTGLALACAFLTRNNLLFIGVWSAYLLLKRHYSQGFRRLAGLGLLGLAPLAAAGLAFLAYNALRFGSPFNVGLDYHQMDALFAKDYRLYSAFNLHYLPINFYYQYIFYPLPIRSETWMGGSLFLMSPLFFAAFWAPWSSRTERWSQLALLASILLVNIPILLLMGTGWVQYGPRYTLDFSIPLLILTAMGMRKWPLWLVSVLIMISIATYVVGTVTPFP